MPSISQAAGEEERPHLQASQALEVPQAVGDGASQLVDAEVPAAVGVGGQGHAKIKRQRWGEIHHYYPHQDGSQAAGEEQSPHLQVVQALEVPQAVGDGAGELVGVEGPAAVGTRVMLC